MITLKLSKPYHHKKTLKYKKFVIISIFSNNLSINLTSLQINLSNIKIFDKYVKVN